MPVNPEAKAGKLDRYVALLSPVYNTAGDEIESWNTVDNAWASVIPVSGVEGNDANRTVAMIYFQVQMRFRPDIDERWRIQNGPMLLEIISKMNVEDRGASLRLQCKEVK